MKLAAVFIIGSTLGPLAAGQQSTWRWFTERRPYLDTRAAVNKDAQASDPAGIHYYAEDLAHLLLPDKAGDSYIDAFADRLAKAEQAAREGKRKLIPEAKVVEAFNKMADPQMAGNADALRRFRTDTYLVKEYPALLTPDRNGTNCYPGEAVFLLTILLQTDGYPVAPAPPPPPSANSIPPPGPALIVTYKARVSLGFSLM